MRTVFSALAFSCVQSHPVVKVLELLGDLKTTVKSEQQTEEISYATYSRWCKSEIATHTKDVADAEKAIADAEEAIAGLSDQIEALQKQQAELGEEIEERTTSQAAADKVRSDAEEAYIALLKDLDDTIAAVKEAVTNVKGTKPGALVQMRESVERLLMMGEMLPSSPGFLQRDGPVVPEAKKYNWKSGNVVELLEKLQKKFEKEKMDAEKGELNAKNQHELSKTENETATKTAQDLQAAKKTAEGTAETDKAAKEGDKSDAEGKKTSSSELLATTKKSCTQRTSEWKERTTTRKDELKAIESAIEILKQVSNVRPPAKEEQGGAGFIQLHRAEDPLKSTILMLKNKASRYHSADLIKVAEALQGLQGLKGGPFDTIKQMIQKMVFRLKQEQTTEDNQKHWCEKEVLKSKDAIADREQNLSQTNNTISLLAADIGVLSDAIVEADGQVTKLVGDIAKLKEDREDDHKENTIDIKDAKEAQDALAKAIAVLRQFYTKSGKMSELQQEPTTWEGSYNGADGSTAVLEKLETVEMDFSKMEAQARSTEESNQKAFQEELSTFEVELAKQRALVRAKTASKAQKEKKEAAKQEQANAFEEQIHSTKIYFSDLHPACFGVKNREEALKKKLTWDKVLEQYKTRQEARTAEVEALKSAQETLAKAFQA